jgi:hypothetical protein
MRVAPAAIRGLGAAALVACTVPAALAQGRWYRESRIEPNLPYDGRFTFARIRYTVHTRSGWQYDYPEMERNFMRVLREITTLRPHEAGSNVHTFDDPELLRFPVAYVSEPGYWIPSEAECAGLRAYVAKGGFVIFDDFMRGEWRNFEAQIARALPGARIVRLDRSHPVFDSFFRIESLALRHPQATSLEAEFYGIFENNDPAARLVAVINYNTDIGDYMEWSGSGWLPVNLTNDAYKLAVNYIVYGMTR